MHRVYHDYAFGDGIGASTNQGRHGYDVYARAGIEMLYGRRAHGVPCPVAKVPNPGIYQPLCGIGKGRQIAGTGCIRNKVRLWHGRYYYRLRDESITAIGVCSNECDIVGARRLIDIGGMRGERGVSIAKEPYITHTD